MVLDPSGGDDQAEAGIGESVGGSFRLSAADTVESMRAEFRSTCARSRELAEGLSPAQEYPWRDGRINLRFFYLHCIQELARHCGHADILRERIADGS